MGVIFFLCSCASHLAQALVWVGLDRLTNWDRYFDEIVTMPLWWGEIEPLWWDFWLIGIGLGGMICTDMYLWNAQIRLNDIPITKPPNIKDIIKEGLKNFVGVISFFVFLLGIWYLFGGGNVVPSYEGTFIEDKRTDYETVMGLYILGLIPLIICGGFFGEAGVAW